MSRKPTALQHSQILYRQFRQTRKANERIRALLAARDVVFTEELAAARKWAREHPELKVSPDDYVRVVLSMADYATSMGMTHALNDIFGKP